MNSSYRDKHVQFVSGLEGTTKEEILVVCMIAPCVILLRNVAVSCLFPQRSFSYWDTSLRFLLDLFITVLPIQLAYTICAEFNCVHILLVTTVALALTIVTFRMREFFWSDRPRPRLAEIIAYFDKSAQTERLALTYARAYISIGTAICILAVDFRVFPRRYAKTETYGYSLMDAGVGLFVVVNAMVSSKAASSARRLARQFYSVWPLLGLGFGRLIVIKLLNYPEHVSEYGVHWNFFVTLAAVKLIGSCIQSIAFLRKYQGLLGLVLITAYQYLLSQAGLKDLLLNGLSGTATTANESSNAAARNDRQTLFDANREGLISLFGYVALYLLSAEFGTVFFTAEQTLRAQFKLILKCLLYFAIAYVGLVLCEYYVDLPSRRFMNSTYLIFILLLMFEHGVLFLAVDVTVRLLAAFNVHLFCLGDQRVTAASQTIQLCLWRAVNLNGLLYFLVANVLTGLVNLTVSTLHVSHMVASFILFGYMSFLSLLVYCLFILGIKIV